MIAFVEAPVKSPAPRPSGTFPYTSSWSRSTLLSGLSAFSGRSTTVGSFASTSCATSGSTSGSSGGSGTTASSAEVMPITATSGRSGRAAAGANRLEITNNRTWTPMEIIHHGLCRRAR